MRKNIFLQDAREVYPESPSDKTMGAVYINLGVRMIISLLAIWIASRILLMPRAWLVTRLAAALMLFGALVYIGYFLYTFQLYLQDNLRKANERRNAELAKRKAIKTVKPAKNTPVDPPEENHP